MTSIKLSRQQSLYRGMNSAAKKVYDVVPMQEWWTIGKIMKELERQGSVQQHKGVNGCLGYMLSVGLVDKNKTDEFQRVPVKIATVMPDDPPLAPPPTKEQIEMATIPENGTLNPLAILSVLGQRARDIAQRASDLEDDALKLSNDIETAALEASVSMDKDAKELTQLRQLKALLAGFNKE